MRIKQPEPFDVDKEYRPGERCVYRGMILIAEVWTKAASDFAKSNYAHLGMFTQRCIRCKIEKDDCPGIGRQCDKFHRSDKKTIYWRLVRMAKGYKGVDTLEFKEMAEFPGLKSK